MVGARLRAGHPLLEKPQMSCSSLLLPTMRDRNRSIVTITLWEQACIFILPRQSCAETTRCFVGFHFSRSRWLGARPHAASKVPYARARPDFRFNSIQSNPHRIPLHLFSIMLRHCQHKAHENTPHNREVPPDSATLHTKHVTHAASRIRQPRSTPSPTHKHHPPASTRVEFCRWISFRFFC
jgi:hypothetical protein